MAGARGNDRWTDEVLDAKRRVCDPLADEPVAEVFARRGVDAVNDIMRTLVHVDQPVPRGLPDELRDYLVTTLPMPTWADAGKIRRGQRIFETWGVHISCCLFCASLPSSYAAASGVQVLARTARLETDARRRVMETGQFLIDVVGVGGLDDDGVGRRTIQKVRLMHGAVRHMIRVREDEGVGRWEFETWGEPVNQEDLAGTMLAFSYVVVEQLPRLGVYLSDDDVDAYLHLWNVVGHLLGVDDDLLVHGVDAATALVMTIRRRQFRASPEGHSMTEALLRLLDEMTPGYLFDDTIPPLIRHLIGDEVADTIGVPKSNLFDDLGRLLRIPDWLIDRVDLTDRQPLGYELLSHLAHPLGRALLHGLFDLQRGGERAAFTMPDRLAGKWGVSV